MPAEACIAIDCSKQPSTLEKEYLHSRQQGCGRGSDICLTVCLLLLLDGFLCVLQEEVSEAVKAQQ
jgi:hypothetical protein